MSNTGLNGSGVQFITLTLKSKGLNNITKQEVEKLLTDAYSVMENEKDATFEKIIDTLTQKYGLSQEVQSALKKALEEMDKADTNSQGYITNDELTKNQYNLEESETVGSYIQEQKDKLILGALEEASDETTQETAQASDDTKTASTNTADVPEGLTHDKTSGDYVDENGIHYRKVALDYLKNKYEKDFGLQFSEDGKITDKDGNEVGVKFKNKAGKVEYYLNQELFVKEDSDETAQASDDTKAASTNTADVPEGLTHDKTSGDYVDENGIHYRKVALDYLKNKYEKDFGLQFSEDGKITDKDGNEVGVKFKNKAGKVEYYLNQELFVKEDSDETTQASDDTKAASTNTADVPEGLSRDDNSGDYVDENGIHYRKVALDYLKNKYEKDYGLQFSEDGKITDKDGNEVGVKFKNKAGKVEYYLNQELFVKEDSDETTQESDDTKAAGKDTQDEKETNSSEEIKNNNGSVDLNIATENGNYVIKTKLKNDKHEVVGIVANNKTITDKKEICKYLTEAILNAEDSDVLAQILCMGAVEFIQKNTSSDEETELLTKIMKKVNYNNKFKEYSDYKGFAPINDYYPNFDFKNNTYTSDVTGKKQIFDDKGKINNEYLSVLHHALISVLKDYSSGNLDEEAAICALCAMSNGDIDNLVKIFRYKEPFSLGKDQEGATLEALYTLMYECNADS